MSDKTTAALAAERADAEATTTQEAELLPAATLDELEQVDLGTVAEGERAPFRITDDRCADWAIRKIADERSEYDRLKALADEQIAAINEKVDAARKPGRFPEEGAARSGAEDDERGQRPRRRSDGGQRSAPDGSRGA